MVVTGCVVGTVTVMVVDLVTVVDAVVVAVEVTVVAVLVGVVVGGYVVVVGDQLQVNNGGPVSKRRTVLQNVAHTWGWRQQGWSSTQPRRER